ncbi:MAG: protein translocase subunit SecF [Actinomycetota bacterium]|nr:protein translocase subunit SecF [Actinomycetota bacterium]
MSTPESGPAPERHRNAWSRLYRGETRFDFVGRRRWWALVSGVVILAGLVSLGVRGVNLGIEFRGGTSWEVPAHGVTVSKATAAVKRVGVVPSLVETLGSGASQTLDVQADLSKLTTAQRTAAETKVAVALAGVTHSSVLNAKRNITDVGATWGGQITHKAILAVIVFFVVVVIYITLRFEWKMAVAALAAVLHDLLVVAGVYSLSGLQVTPDTVVAVLTILGYSLYDTVVVFDRVADNTKGLGARGTMTYEDVVNLSMNQTLARSINTSLVAILPVLSVLVVGAQILGATTLQYFGFALVIGLLSGTYSSIFIASPLLAVLKEREPRYRSIRQKLASRADRTGLLTPRAAAELAVATAGPGAGRPVRNRPSTNRSGALRPGSARAANGRGRVLQPSRSRGPSNGTVIETADPAHPARAVSGERVAGGGANGADALDSPGGHPDANGASRGSSTAGAGRAPRGSGGEAPDSSAAGRGAGGARPRPAGQNSPRTGASGARRPSAQARKKGGKKGGRRR